MLPATLPAAGISLPLAAGGEDSPVSPRLLSLVDLLAPNEQVEARGVPCCAPTAVNQLRA